jgi:hypothetical protein
VSRAEDFSDRLPLPNPVATTTAQPIANAAPAVWFTPLRFVWRVIKVVWASPNTLFGVFVGGVGLVAGTRVRFRDGCLEFWGGNVAWLLRRLPNSPIAMTLGHVVLGIDETSLCRVGLHERIHVRQYERWGPLFLPAYGLASWWAWRRGLNAYFDNVFEVEAYADDARRAALEATVEDPHKH